MIRMVLARFVPHEAYAPVRLGPADEPALHRLYADGEVAGEAPPFFIPEMLVSGVYHGVWEDGELIAAGGTHVLAPKEGVAAIGNIYTRRDRRGADAHSPMMLCLTSRPAAASSGRPQVIP